MEKLRCEACDEPHVQLVGLRFFNADKSFCKEYYRSYKEIKIRKSKVFDEMRKEAEKDFRKHE